MVFALSMPLLMGGAGLVAETSFDYFQKNHLQAAADAAAYAGALEDRAGSSAATIAAAANAQATSNGWSSSSGTITVNSPPASGANLTPNAVEVLLTMNAPRFFSAVFSSQPITVSARAVAIAQTAANACILALDKTAPAAVQVQGNSTLNLTGCDVMSNSVASNAVDVWGSAKLMADCVMSAGGITNKSGLTLTGCFAGITQAPRVADPFAGLPTPSPGQNRSIPNGNKGTTTLQPGSYSNGMSLSGTVVLSPGTYYVSGGNFSVNANANVSGSGVTIYLVAGSQVTMRGNASVSLAAPTSGTYSGILFFGDRAAAGGSNTFNGDAASSFTGDIYFPTQQVSYLGNFSGTNGCTQIVADQVQWSGNATVAVNCSSYGMAAIPGRQAVTLVE
ncbi:MAG TPA: pilus assembly protein TadG-related protein [Phenylobacterium sp.]|jgi:Flp pilus assembly protein TadG|uniref:pilus assembly protein TadG-related protein n=1 Tax=Phenylobacterium sp. TaxID=1871053 RepID=UPI002B759A18|nr:pilus assembly protein TadG-related protein [Phenylobacterium sp.]HXA39193.1 pilus assembly protein TadG-related protein [Phenylobacterium sp.]